MAATDERKIPFCTDPVLELKKCHDETSKISQWLGGCNAAKVTLDRCLRENRRKLGTERLEQQAEDDKKAEADREKFRIAYALKTGMTPLPKKQTFAEYMAAKDAAKAAAESA